VITLRPAVISRSNRFYESYPAALTGVKIDSNSCRISLRDRFGKKVFSLLREADGIVGRAKIYGHRHFAPVNNHDLDFLIAKINASGLECKIKGRTLDFLEEALTHPQTSQKSSLRKWEKMFASDTDEEAISRVSMPPFIRDGYERLLFRNLSPEMKRVLEAGQGSGKFIIAKMTEFKDTRFYGLDIIPANLQTTLRAMRALRISASNYFPIIGDVFEMPFPDGSFDLVYNYGVLEHFSNPFLVINEMDRVLQPGGRMIISVPNALALRVFAKWLVNRIGGHWKYEYEREMLPAEIVSQLEGLNYRIARVKGFSPFWVYFDLNFCIDRGQKLPPSLNSLIGKIAGLADLCSTFADRFCDGKISALFGDSVSVEAVK